MALIETPTPWQEGVLGYNENCNLAIFGGRGAGRTTAALFIAMRHCEKHGHGAHVIFIRQMLRSLREVEDNLHSMCLAQYGAQALRVNRQDHMFVLPGGGTIEFAPINDTEDMAKIQGRSFSLLIADEYGNFSPQQMRFVDQIRANMRAGNIPCRFVLLANPGGRGHGLIKERFVDRMVPHQVGVMEDNQHWAWVPANYKENPHNPANYAQALFAAALKDKELFRAWTEGAWNIARGAMFADCIDEEHQRVKFDATMQVLAEVRENELDPVMLKTGMQGYLAGDWGQSAPAVCFAAVRTRRPMSIFPRGSLILLDEISSADPDDRSHGMNWSIGKFAENVDAMVERTGVMRSGVIDDQKGLQPNDTLIAALEGYNFGFERPMKNRRTGWASLREHLTNSKERNGKAGLWLTERCTGWWETVPLLPRDPLNMEDVDTRAIDHWADASRYACVHNPGEVVQNSSAVTAEKYPTNAGPGAPTLA